MTFLRLKKFSNALLFHHVFKIDGVINFFLLNSGVNILYKLLDLLFKQVFLRLWELVPLLIWDLVNLTVRGERRLALVRSLLLNYVLSYLEFEALAEGFHFIVYGISAADSGGLGAHHGAIIFAAFVIKFLTEPLGL